MRDYKNVKVPRSFRSTNRRTIVKRVEVGSGSCARRTGSGMSPRMLATFVIAAAIISCGWFAYDRLTHAEMFQVAGVDVKGVRNMGEAEIREIAATFKGGNIFTADLASAHHRVAANPWISSVHIDRRLPDRITMVVTERTPVAVLEAANGRFLLDAYGVVIIPLVKDAVGGAGLPVIAQRELRAAPQDQISTGGMRDALNLLAELKARGGWDPAGLLVHADSPESVSVEYAGHEFRIGSGNYDEKLRRLGEIVADMKQRGLEFAYIELRPDRQAAVLVKNSKAPGQQVRGRKRA